MFSVILHLFRSVLVRNPAVIRLLIGIKKFKFQLESSVEDYFSLHQNN